jgi:oxygen-independent coproporphyrinogen-3 oxidase
MTESSNGTMTQVRDGYAPTHRHLLERYADERLPRYTSYPTAPHFSQSVSMQDYAQWLGCIGHGLSASIYLHVPFCRSMCWYCGCHTTVARRDGPVSDYADALRDEIALVADHVGHRAALAHVHFGGGTPTILAPSALVGLVEKLHHRFDLRPGAEIAIEIDPRTLSEEMAEALPAAGVTRASLGIQSFDARVQEAINRVQSFIETARCVERLRRGGFRSINFDLIYGLPHQTVDSCLDSVRQCLRLRPDRLSVFGYAHVPDFKKHQRRINEAALPTGPERLAQAAAIADALEAAGYVRIGLDHFALPEDSLARAAGNGGLRRNFQGYTTDPGEVLIGLGASAIGRLSQGFVQNEVVPGHYAERIRRGELATIKGYAMTADDRLRGAIIERIMCDFAVDLESFASRHGLKPDQILALAPRLRQLVCDGIVELDGTRLAVRKDARSLVRTVASAFDACLAGSTRRHSRAV